MTDFKKIIEAIRSVMNPRNSALSALLLLFTLFWVILIIDGLVFWSSYRIVAEPPQVSGKDIPRISQSELERVLDIIEKDR